MLLCLIDSASIKDPVNAGYILIQMEEFAHRLKDRRDAGVAPAQIVQMFLGVLMSFPAVESVIKSNWNEISSRLKQMKALSSSGDKS